MSADELMPAGDPARRGCRANLYPLLAGGWILFVTSAIHVPAWVAEGLNSRDGLAPTLWAALTWGNLALIALAVVPAALASRASRFRRVYATWALASAVAALAGAARLLDRFQVDTGLALQGGLGVLGAVILLAARRHRDQVASGEALGPADSAAAWPACLALGILAGYPSIAWGALGSPWETLAGLVSGLGYGAAAAALLGVSPDGAGPDAASSSRLPLAWEAYAAGVTLFILAAGFGWRGSELLLLLAMPPLGIAAAVCRRAEGRAGGPAGFLSRLLLAGLPAAALAMFWDPEELTILLGGGDIPTWAFRAAGATLAIVVLAGLVARAYGARASRPSLSRAAGPGLAVATLLAGLALYRWVGQPGLYGEQFFVILRDQADVSAASALPGRDARLSYVYKTLTRHAEQTQARLRAELERTGVSYRAYYLVNALEVNGGPALRAQLARAPEVARILNSPHLRPLPEPPPAAAGHEPGPYGPGWNIKAIGADRVWSELGVTGRGIVIGQSDSGVQGDHPALAASYRGRGAGDDYNWLDPWNGARRPVDSGGHGTHTLGSVLGAGGIGVAPGATWFACVNLARNLGNPAAYLNCLQFMLAPYPHGGDPFRDGDPARAAHVINDSWGCPPVEGCDPGALAPATRALRAAGIYVVASAGNDGPGCGSLTDPIAIYADVLSVGATDAAGKLAFFSSRGPVEVDGSGRTKPDVVAPGQAILSAFPESTYAVESGTSMAGPHVVGVVALMWSANPRLIGDVERTTRMLLDTARPYTATVGTCGPRGRPNDDAGYGSVDAYAAVRAALAEK